MFCLSGQVFMGSGDIVVDMTCAGWVTVRTHCAIGRAMLSAFWLVCSDRFANGSLLTGGLFLLSALISLGVRCALLKTGSSPCLVAPSFSKLSMVFIVRWSMSCISFERVLIFVQFLPPVARS